LLKKPARNLIDKLNYWSKRGCPLLMQKKQYEIVSVIEENRFAKDEANRLEI